MSLSMYQASIPTLLRGLDSLAAILAKAAAHAAARKIAPEVLLNARLAPDMLPLVRQVQIVSDTAKGCAARLAGIEVPSYADTEASFDELQERLAKTATFLKGVAPEQIDGSEERAIVLKAHDQEIHFTGRTYLLGFVLPNFYFHLTTAYGILRHNGVEIGKKDYLGEV
ncbi:hypothetical protein SAMN05216201_11331 [Pseudomonas linyingensis]|uniref:DUF1993 domain-containing protein n=1 Tax=Pseudomonas linyingensis TaxID=915471 RepID=A0A1H7AKB3_9PSED|nr:DUF1993 domain-containing protein [Pseudomonas linyingensis]SEJ65024.1 hypothetical protein SAMN05216201_11331 [Pseudomonas linyingensis]